MLAKSKREDAYHVGPEGQFTDKRYLNSLLKTLPAELALKGSTGSSTPLALTTPPMK
jgi:hypothetical protein